MRPLWLSKSATADKLLSRQVWSIVSNPAWCGETKGARLLELATVSTDPLQQKYLAAVAVNSIQKCILKHAAEDMQKYLSHAPMQISKSYDFTKELRCDRCGHAFSTTYKKGMTVSCQCGRTLATW